MTTEPPRILHGDCIDIMRTLPENSVDSIVTDPPYGLGFMGKKWDALPPGEEWARECLRVLKPGGHLLAFGGSRTWHRLAVAVEDAGFEIRDSIAWMYGSGFPKSHDVSKAIDKAAGAEREVIGPAVRVDGKPRNYESWAPHQTGSMSGTLATAGPNITAPATPAAARWKGWGTALKPAFEPVVMARKPLIGTVAANVQAHGTGAINIDGCRIAGDEDGSRNRPPSRLGSTSTYAQDEWTSNAVVARRDTTGTGRWPANVALDEHMAAALDQQAPKAGSWSPAGRSYSGHPVGSSHIAFANEVSGSHYGDSGGASRFFYVAKAPKKERPVVDGIAHPTVKPLALMRWLVRLVTPPGGVVLEPFAGSGATVEACILEGFHCIAIEREAEYLPLIQARIDRQDAAA